MPSFMIQASYSTAALASLTKKPQDRTDVIRKSVEKLGGTLTGVWLSFGEYDTVVIFEVPDHESAAALALAVRRRRYMQQGQDHLAAHCCRRCFRDEESREFKLQAGLKIETISADSFDDPLGCARSPVFASERNPSLVDHQFAGHDRARARERAIVGCHAHRDQSA